MEDEDERNRYWPGSLKDANGNSRLFFITSLAGHRVQLNVARLTRPSKRWPASVSLMCRIDSATRSNETKL